ncbi:hypothetical protein J2W21_001356 [Sinomonas atrocyanea]|nr:hypothetical protein [Sinomonas atrocyanea]
MLHGEAAHDVAVLGTLRHEPAARLEAEHPAPRRGVPDRAAEVSPVGQRHDARRDGRRRPAARAGGRARGVPGVADGAVERRLAVRGEAELAGGGLAHGHEPGAGVPQGELLGVRRDGALGPARALPERRARDLEREVLDQERHPDEGCAGRGWREAGVVRGRLRGRDCPARGCLPHESVQPRTEQAHPFAGLGLELSGARLPGPHQLGLREPVAPAQLLVHRSQRTTGTAAAQGSARPLRRAR